MWNCCASVDFHVNNALTPQFKLVFLLSSALAYVDEQPYCAPRYRRLCLGKGQHIACQFYTPGASESCLNYTQIKFTRELKHFVTHYLNRRRQRLAAGHERVRGGAPVPRPELMMLVEWDRELAYLAQRLADQCTFVHDDCRATIRYPYAGQTVGEVKWRRSSDPDEMVAQKAIRRVFDAWWGERRRITTQQMISPFKVNNKGTVWGHFTQLAVWKLRAVGCGAVRHGEDYARLLLVCDFSHTNMLGQQTINPGPLLQCPIHTVRRPRSSYPLLCGPIRHYHGKEASDPNDDSHDRDDEGMSSEEDNDGPLDSEEDKEVVPLSSTARDVRIGKTRRFHYGMKAGLGQTKGEFEVIPMKEFPNKPFAKERLQQELHTTEESSEELHTRKLDYAKFHEYQGMTPDARYRKIWRHPTESTSKQKQEFITREQEMVYPMSEAVRERLQGPIRSRWKFTRERPRRPGADALLSIIPKGSQPKVKGEKDPASVISLKMDQDDVDQLFKDTGFNPNWRRKTKS